MGQKQAYPIELFSLLNFVPWCFSFRIFRWESYVSSTSLGYVDFVQFVSVGSKCQCQTVNVMCDRNEMGFVQKLAMQGNENFQDEMKMPFFPFLLWNV